MENAFQLLQPPSLTTVAAFRFAHHKVRGSYQPWSRVQTLDAAAEALERVGVERVGPAFGIYDDLPYSTRPADDWVARLGWPVADRAQVPTMPGLRVIDIPTTDVVGLRYRGDLTSFPPALQFLVEWSMQRGIDLHGPLLERFYVSDALKGVEERDVFVALRPLSPGPRA